MKPQLKMDDSRFSEKNVYLNNYIKSLDGLRAISIALVLFFHAGIILCGWIGVQIFFVLSGYLITQNLIKNKSQSLSSFIKNFYWHRSLRIFPLYFGFLLFVSFIYLISGHPTEFKQLYPYLITYTYNLTIFFRTLPSTGVFNHFWSLCVEEQFYLIWPFAIYFASRHGIKRIILSILIAIPLVRYLLGNLLLNSGRNPMEVGNNIYWFTLTQMDSLMLGAFISISNIQKSLQKSQLLFFISFGLFLFLGLLNFGFARFEDVYFARASLGYPLESIVNYQYVWSYTVINMMSATLVLWAINREVIQKKPITIFIHPFILRIGKISYGMYVFHNPIRKLVLEVTDSSVMGFKGIGLLNLVLYLSLTYLISELSYRYFESIFLRLKKVRM